jgi:hypothetical protein
VTVVSCDRAEKLTSDVTKANTKILYTFCIRFRFVVLLAEKQPCFPAIWFRVLGGAN